MNFEQEFSYKIGWVKAETLALFGNDYPVTVKLQAYKTDKTITDAQKQAYLFYQSNSAELLSNAEQALCDYDKNSPKRFVPTRILIQRDGETALLLDDSLYPDEGMAVVLNSDEHSVQSQDDYL